MTKKIQKKINVNELLRVGAIALLVLVLIDLLILKLNQDFAVIMSSRGLALTIIKNVVVVLIVLGARTQLNRSWLRASSVAIVFLVFGLYSFVDGMRGEANEPVIWEGIGAFYSVVIPITKWGIGIADGIYSRFLCGVGVGTIYYLFFGLIFEKLVGVKEKD